MMVESSQSIMQQTYVQQPRSSSFKNFQFNPVQMIQLESYRLHFLCECKKLKRPPQSLRFSGGNSLTPTQRSTIISEMETKALECAIKNHKKKIYNMKEKLKN